MDIEFIIDQKEYQISALRKGKKFEINLDNQSYEFEATFLTPNCILLEDQTQRKRIDIAEGKDKTFVFFNGSQIVLEHVDPSSQSAAMHESDVHDGGADICAPMPGKVLKILVEQNQEVQPKQSLVIVEAMKMEHNITAPKKAVVKQINFKEGDLVDTGQQILELEVLEE